MFKKKHTKRKVPIAEWVNVVWLALLILALLVYWIYTPSLLSELISLFEKAISGEPILLSEVIANFILLFAWLSTIRFFALIVVSIITGKEIPLIIGNFVYAIISAALGYIFNSWYHASLSTFEIGRMLLILFSLYTTSKGIADGWFYENEPRILVGDWSGIIRGTRVLILSLFFTEENFSIFEGFTSFLAEKFGLTLAQSGFLTSFFAFLEICLFVFLLTELPARLVFTKCKKCGILLLNIGVRHASWDSEHTSKHRHCPRCGAACF